MRIFNEIHDAQGITEIYEPKREVHKLITKTDRGFRMRLKLRKAKDVLIRA